MGAPSRTLPVVAVNEQLTTRRLLPASLARAEAGGVRCLACTRRCLLHHNRAGFCSAIENEYDQLVSTAYGVVAEASVTPIESKPVFHYLPGSQVLSLGGLGCNLRCRFCQNWEIAFRSARHAGGLSTPNLPPEKAINLALEQGAQGLAWTFNEPSISPVYTADCARLAREAGLFTVYVTNGLLTQEALSLLGDWLDVYRVDVKSLDAAFYRRIGATDRIAEILPVARRAQQEFGIHVEAVTNLMPGLNDADEHLTRLADQLVLQLGEEVPWHLTSYIPYAFMRDVPPTPPETLARARQIGYRAGLHFVYTDSVTDPESAYTRCPMCRALVIERSPGRVIACGLDLSGACRACGTALGIVTAARHHQ
jgi:pyruvate formate lyase activating enzyme